MQLNGIRRKLIEVALPLEAINAASAREKSIRHGHPSTLHLWWARRPLAACRAVLFAQLVDDPSAWPNRFRGEDAQKAERERLHKLIERLVPWEASNDETVLNEARYEIARSLAWGRGEEPPPASKPEAVRQYLLDYAPPVYDPFCGGGSIPLEAQRLGLRAIASDLNPVAVMITKALVEFPPKFAGRPPVNPDAQAKLKAGGTWTAKGAQGLAEDVRWYGRWMRTEAEKRIGHFYPKARLPDGSEATVIAWLWARTVKSPNPAARGAMVPLVSSFLLSTRPGKEAWVAIVPEAAARDGWRFEVRNAREHGEPPADVRNGTKASRGAHFRCCLTGAAIEPAYIKAEGKAKRMGARLLAIVAEGRGGRIYLPPDDEHERIAASARQQELQIEHLAAPVPARLTGGTCYGYGLTTWADLFTPRQLVALTTFSDLVLEARTQALEDAKAAGFSPAPNPLAEGGKGAQAYADTLAVYFAFTLSRCTDFWSSNASWVPAGEFSAHTFTRQAIPMIWDYAECNPFSNSSGNFEAAFAWIAKVADATPAEIAGSVSMLDAANGTRPVPSSPITDSPYYDNIGYADLSDFFYVWLRRTLKEVFPREFTTVLVPKERELVATPYRFRGGRQEAERFFLDGMRRAIANVHTASVGDMPTTIYYAFKQAEIESEGVVSTGWATFLEATIEAGFQVDGTWPMRTERPVGFKAAVNGLASSIVLVCRKRPADAPSIGRAEFLRALRQELPPALKTLQASTIAPVDMAQASIGPGMAVFSRYSEVLEADDTPMSVREALMLINHELDAFLAEQEGEFDSYSRFAVGWFEHFGWGVGKFGEANVMATGRGTGVQAIVDAGILYARAGEVRLLKRCELDPAWDIRTDTKITVWECCQHLIRRLEGEGEDSAARLLQTLGHYGERAGDLAYRLYAVCERKRWAEEARAYNGLIVAWPRIARLAEQMAAGPVRRHEERQGQPV